MSDQSASGEARGPVATLRRIAFLMERQREESRRIEAFRNAARTILPLPEDEVRRRAESGTLTELAGIAATAPIASRLTKIALADGGHADFESALQWEALAQPLTLATADLQEGIAAAREKRAPEFRGH